MSTLITLENTVWQVGILPSTGASIAFGRVRQGAAWHDVLRPTAEADYDSSSRCASFIMLPWCNRIRGGLLRFGGQEYRLRVEADDGTARHGDVRKRPWHLDESGPTSIRLSICSADFDDSHWPFRYSASAVYDLNGADFVWTLTLTNEDNRPMPGGFGHHPYFVKSAGADAPQVQIPCDQQFELADFMAVNAPVPITADVDFRQPRPLPEGELNHLLTGRQGDRPARILYPQTGISVEMHSDPVFVHNLIYTPLGQPFFALEPMSSASDGFNLFDRGIAGSGVTVLEPGSSLQGTVRLRAASGGA